MKEGEGWSLGNGGDFPFTAFDEKGNSLPIRKYMDSKTNEVVYAVVHHGEFEIFHVPAKLTAKKDWQVALKLSGDVTTSIKREVTELNKAGIKNATIYVSGPDKVEPRKAQIKER